MLHHEEPQHILLAGESYSGKTTQMKRAVDHLCILGEGNSNCNDRVKKAIDLVHQLVNAGSKLQAKKNHNIIELIICFFLPQRRSILIPLDVAYKHSSHSDRLVN